MTSVILALTPPSGAPLRLRAEVIRCARVSDGYYDVGARFLTLEPNDDKDRM